MTMRVRCPTDPTPYDDPRPHDPPEGMAGCGTIFDSEPDDEGFVDCPGCGMFFRPRPQDIIEPRGGVMNTLTIEFTSDEASATISEALGALVGLVVDLEVEDGYPSTGLQVVTVDGDGDLVVADTPQLNSTYAIPQASIRRVKVLLQGAA